MPQPEWPTRLVRVIADEIRRRREAHQPPMSAQQLAEACGKIGLDISRSTLADLENGRRVTFTVAELLVIAAALDIPPVRLIVPLDRESAELLPGHEINPWAAMQQFTSEPGNPDDPFTLLAEHERLLGYDLLLYRQNDQNTRAQRPAVAADIRRIRQRMRKQSLLPPPLPVRLEYLDNGETMTAPPSPESVQPQEQPVVAAIVTSPLGVLVGRRNDRRPPWGFISGEIEPGELPDDAAVREVKEETGLEVRAGQLIGERDHPATGRHMIYMAAEPTRGTEVFVGDEAELAEVRWVSLAEADELLPGMFAPAREYLVVTIGAGSAS
jgi:8-oxo-dGTP pyrophosphatase MutT (NUDIX family)/transcriptional regulator with XRE-family HTH domain